MRPNETFFRALHLASSLGIPVFPLAEGTKIPPKGHHGYKEATTDNLIISDWFHRDPVTDHKPHPFYNIGIDLRKAGLIVVDLDKSYQINGETKHSNTNGIKNFNDYVVENNLPFPRETYCETTPSGGLHVFLKLDEPLDTDYYKTSKIGALNGVDIIANYVPVAPSEIDGVGSYRPTYNGLTIDDIKPCPDWVKNMLLKENDTNVVRPIVPRWDNQKHYLGKLLDEIVAGTTEGNRNEWLTSITGKLFYTHAEPSTVYECVNWANERYVIPPLPDNEVNSIYTSVGKYQFREG